jgi:phosphate transport system permease protein
VLAGIPSIVLGFLGWIALAPLIQKLGAPTGLTAFTGSLILAYMSLPTIISIAEDALYAVPKEYRDGALAIGATQWQAIWRVVLPAARPGLMIAVMLGIGRAIGETMAVMMVTGNAANIPSLGSGIFFQPVRTMTATIAAEMGEVAQGSLHYSTLFAIGIVLFLISFAINSLAGRLVGVEGCAARAEGCYEPAADASAGGRRADRDRRHRRYPDYFGDSLRGLAGAYRCCRGHFSPSRRATA